jgi:hypothetical protein
MDNVSHVVEVDRPRRGRLIDLSVVTKQLGFPSEVILVQIIYAGRRHRCWPRGGDSQVPWAVDTIFVGCRRR